MSPLRVFICGAGKIGTALAMLLAREDEFSVNVIDHSEDALHAFESRRLPCGTRLVRNRDELRQALASADVTVAAVPESAVESIMAAADAAGTHYLDFSPSLARSRQCLAALAGKRAVLTGCGVSPGIIDNMVTTLFRDFAPVNDLTVRVGSIPQVSTNRLGYGQIWDVDGLISEYTKPCAAIRNAQHVITDPLQDYERIVIDGTEYECFTTAGGLENLEALAVTKPVNVTFKTLRYPGHLEYMRFLLEDLNLRNRRDMLRNLLLNGLPVIADDVLLLAVTARGNRNGQIQEKTISHRFVPNPQVSPFNALTTIAVGYAATLLLLLSRGDLALTGFVPHHAIRMEQLLSERFLKEMGR